jgi:hypothetical protein
MIKIEVVSTEFDEKSGTSQRNKPYTIREQAAYAHVLDAQGKPGKYPVACKLPLEADQPPYQPGFYTVDPRSVVVGDFGRLGFGRVKLQPLAPAVSKAA